MPKEVELVPLSGGVAASWVMTGVLITALLRSYLRDSFAVTFLDASRTP